LFGFDLAMQQNNSTEQRRSSSCFTIFANN